MMKRITFLTTTFLSPCLMFSMDEPEYKTPEALIVHKKDVLNLCVTTYTMLGNFKPRDEKSATYLIDAIEQTYSLKEAKITEKQLGFHIFRKKPTTSLMDVIKNSFSFNEASIFASVFFERLANYNAHLCEKGLISPNKTQIHNHLKNIKINKTANDSTQFGINIPQQTLDEKTIQTPGSVAVDAFILLMDHINEILKQSPKQIKRTAKLIYHNELKNYPQNNTEATCQQ